VRKNSACVARRQYDGQLGRACDALDIADEIEFSLEHLLIEKQECGESLILRRGSDMFFSCEMRKEFGNFTFAHFAWMTFAMKGCSAESNPRKPARFGSNSVLHASANERGRAVLVKTLR
jgi:hypothetical protein